MRRFFLAILAGLACAGACLAAEPVARFSDFVYSGHAAAYAGRPAGPGEYLNPILEGFYPDPSVLRVGDDYYLVNSTFIYFPGLPIFHSRDLVNWTQIGNAIDRPDQFDFTGMGISRGIYAPDISYHGGVFYLVGTCVYCGGNFVMTARNAAGPWSAPTWLGFEGIDPSLFFDQDGKAWLVNNGQPEGTLLYDGHRAIWLQAFDPVALRMIGPRTVLVDGGVDPRTHPTWIEGPHLLRHGADYFLIAAEGGTAENHSEVAFRSASVTGPYVPIPRNPILTQRDLDPARALPITSTGHASFVTTAGGDWWAVFLGTRPYRDGFYNTGRETFLAPVRWEEGVPRVIDPGQVVPYRAKRPDLPAQPAPAQATSGDFTVRERFDHGLPKDLVLLRTPKSTWWRTAGGALQLEPRPDPLGGTGQPAFIGRRQQHPNAQAQITVRYAPDREGARAGLAAFQSETNFYVLAAERAGGRLVVRVEQRASAADPQDGRVLASAPLAGRPGAPLRLKITARGDRYDFAYAAGRGPWRTLLADADGTVLSTKAAGGFVGAMIGPYAYAPQP